jgi:hypothetical protein
MGLSFVGLQATTLESGNRTTRNEMHAAARCTIVMASSQVFITVLAGRQECFFHKLLALRLRKRGLELAVIQRFMALNSLATWGGSSEAECGMRHLMRCSPA